MKTLILASSGSFVTSYDFNQYLPKPIAECKIAFIITASKGVDDLTYIEKHRKRMSELNYDYIEIDLDGKNEEELRKLLDGYDIVLVEGGNTFYLLKAVRESGFKNVIKDLLDKGVVYIGSSAGSYITCPIIISSIYSEKPKDRYGMTDFTAMSIVPFVLKAHYRPELLPKLKEARKKLDYLMRLINDSQALLIRDEEVTLLGGGEEIIL